MFQNKRGIQFMASDIFLASFDKVRLDEVINILEKEKVLKQKAHQKN